MIYSLRSRCEIRTKYGIFPHEIIPLIFSLRYMRDSDKIWLICARDYLIDIFTKINARHGSLTCLSTSETLRSDSNQKILYSVPVLDKIRPCQARYDEKRLYRRQEPLDQAQIERYYIACLFWTKYFHDRHDITNCLFRRQKRLDQTQIKRSCMACLFWTQFVHVRHDMMKYVFIDVRSP